MWVTEWNIAAPPDFILLVTASYNAMLIKPGPQTLGSAQVAISVINVNYNIIVN